MKERIYNYTVAIIFFILAVLHLARIVYDWQAVIGGAIIPMWVSWAAVIIAGYMSARAWHFAKRA